MNLLAPRRLLVVVAGLFASLALLISPAMASVGTVSTTPLSGVAATDGSVYATAVVGNMLVVGGKFTSVNGQPRSNVAAFDAETGALLSWTADTDGAVRAITAVDGEVALGGDFTTVDGSARSYLAVVDSAGTLQAVSLAVNNSVLALTASGTTLYFGGKFTKVGKLPNSHLAAVDVVSGALSSTFAPNPNGRITALALYGTSTLLVGGNYRSIAGAARINLAAVTIATGSLTTPTLTVAAGCPVFALAVNLTADRIVVGCAGYNGGNRVVAFTHNGGNPVWTRYTDGNVQAVVIVGSTVYVGGHFDKVDSYVRKHLAAVSLTTGTLTSFSVTMNSALGVWAEAATADRLWIGGEFTKLQGKASGRVGGFAITG